MKFRLCSLIIVLTCVLGWSARSMAQNQNTAPLTNSAIVKFAKAGFKEKTILAIIAARPPAFDLSPDRMIELKRNGVTEKIIVAMLTRQEGLEFDDESWSEELSTGNETGSRSTQPSSEGETRDIFGSSGGTKGNTRSRGTRGSIAEDTQTTGSATVRIIRPPTEAGAAVKMEKTPSLTNDSIVELVEAGFSEGTIIRRIEQSPVQFDLTPNKLEELRRHRVGEKILEAMKAAMGDESSGR